MTFVDVGLRDTHPVLAVKDFIKGLDSMSRMDTLLMGNRASQLETFWRTWQELEPGHPIFDHHKTRLGQCIPMALHADEGTSIKKKALMVLQYQPLLGCGSRKAKRKANLEVAGVNLLGNSLKTRFLYSVMLARLYSGKKKQNRPLMALVHQLCLELRNFFYEGCMVTIDGVQQRIFLITLGMKGDWPALAKLGNLARHHGRVTSTHEDGKGICHLRVGGMFGKHWYNTSYENMMAMREGAPVPWKKEPSMTKEIPMDGNLKANFFKIDIFHTCHKGLMADLAANIIVPHILHGKRFWKCFFDSSTVFLLFRRAWELCFSNLSVFPAGMLLWLRAVWRGRLWGSLRESVSGA